MDSKDSKDSDPTTDAMVYPQTPPTKQEKQADPTALDLDSNLSGSTEQAERAEGKSDEGLGHGGSSGGLSAYTTPEKKKGPNKDKQDQGASKSQVAGSGHSFEGDIIGFLCGMKVCLSVCLSVCPSLLALLLFEYVAMCMRCAMS